MAALPGVVLLACLILTKSRSAYLGLMVGAAVVAWNAIRGLPRRAIALGLGGLIGVVVLLVAVGAATGHLDLLQPPGNLGSAAHRTTSSTADCNVSLASRRNFDPYATVISVNSSLIAATTSCSPCHTGSVSSMRTAWPR